jgi:choline dehydrogenase-like flavoprotein
MQYDVIVIGTGAGGGTAAHRLASKGLSVLILERGGMVPREPENWDPWEVFVKGRYASPETILTSSGKRFQPTVHYNVGGSTKFYGAALYRMREGDFRSWKYSYGNSQEWPISYGDLEPYYAQAEHLYAVRGNAGEDPTEPPRSTPYPYRALSHDPWIQTLSDALTDAGHHPFHSPNGLLRDDLAPETSVCVRCQFCDGHPCPVNGKADAQTMAITPALQRANVTLVTNARVLYLNVSAVGEVTSVVALIDSQMVTFHADMFVLAAGAINTALILQTSEIGGKAAGRYYHAHTSMAVSVLSKEPNLTRHQKTLAIHDFIRPMGSIQMLGKVNGADIEAESVLARHAPSAITDRVAAHTTDFWLTVPDAANWANRVHTSNTGATVLDYVRSGQGEMTGLRTELRDMLHKTGLFYPAMFSKTMGIEATAHQGGTARMGHGPETSVVGPDCKAHGTVNLYIADTSVFPGPTGAVNPALTCMALALRTAETVAARLVTS